MRSRLLELLADGPLTVPELAAASGFPEDEVMVWMMGLRKYGYVAEVPEPDGDYFRYQAVSVSADRRPSSSAPRSRAFDAEACMNCGVCTADVPRRASTCCRAGCSATPCSGWPTACEPRSETVFSCLLCRACEESCPARRAHHRERARPSTLAARGGILMPLPDRDVSGSSPTTCACAARCCRSRPGGRRDGRASSTSRAAARPSSTPGMMYQLIPYIERLVRARAAARGLAARALQRARHGGRTAS